MPAYTQHKYKSLKIVDNRGDRSCEVIEVELTYSNGNDGRPKGFSLHAQPGSYERYESGVTIHRYSPHEGVRKFVHPCNRFSQKQVRLAIEAGAKDVDTLVQYLVDRYGFEIVSELAADGGEE